MSVDYKISLNDKYALDTTRAYMTGIEALVRLPMLQRQRDVARGLNTAGFVSGYRGSPLGGVDQAMWSAKPWLTKHSITFQPGVNEELAATAVWGSQQTQLFEGARYDGVFSMWYGKGPGVDRSMDVIKHANAFGTAKFGGVLAIAGDDHACKSSTLPHQSEHNFIAASVPVLSPANVQEVLDLGVFGWELSRYSGCWVALKAITENMDSAISADIDPARMNIVIPDSFVLPADGVHARWPDKPLDQELRLNKYKIYAAREFARVNNLNPVVIDSPNARFGIMCAGKAYLDVMQALDDMGINAPIARQLGLRVMKVGMPWPLEPVSVHNFAEGLEEILVVEEKRSVIEDQLTGQLYNNPVVARPRVVGEFDEQGRDLLPNAGELTPAMIAVAIYSRVSRYLDSETMRKRVEWIKNKEAFLAKPYQKTERVPHFCSGCPHNTSTKVPEGSRALGGIGCHYMATWMLDRNTQTFSQMGGEGAAWIGQAPFTETQHVFQNLGDGTYFHSGILALRAAVAAKVNITYKILYNDAVAMTGGQPIDGDLSVESLVKQVLAEGISKLVVVSDAPDQWRGLAKQLGVGLEHRQQFDAVQTQLRDIAGTTVIIYVQTCAAEKRRRRKKAKLIDPPRRVVINPEVCEGCGDCSAQSNCLSVVPKETALGRKRQIDQSSCNKDFRCVDGFCPSFVTVLDAGLVKSSVDQVLLDDFVKDLPEPTLPALEQPWNTVVAGVGGTGVLTITALIAMAAHLEGKGCATLNQTGLAQKFGAVVSHVRVARRQSDILAVRIPAGEADLLLGCDFIVACGDETLAKVAHERTHAVLNRQATATSDLITNPDASIPYASLTGRVETEIDTSQLVWLDATRIATQVMGDSIASNCFLLGVAYQAGWLPVSSEALDRAIELNGVGIEMNRQAFVWGRLWHHNPHRVEALLAQSDEPESYQSLDDLIKDYHERLYRYQDEEYADLYYRRVAHLRQYDKHEDQMATRAFARGLYKLMAIKDEYEVARLHTSAEFTAMLDQQFSGKRRLRFHLAPPLLAKKDPATGQLQKREFGAWILPLFKLLAAVRAIRGTAFDVFSYTDERRAERQDILDYLQLMHEEILPLIGLDYQKAVVLLESVRGLRGFGHVKDRNRTLVKQRQKELLSYLAISA
ncbi:MAG: indolepyruvate ferredoxin oxidoreductase family protein [Halieaceae bacterium]|nr:indolepyruvate ferredoxin oxidoreductase family protein [Halieaceae bacterium]